MELRPLEKRLILGLIEQELMALKDDEAEFAEFIQNSPVFNKFTSDDIQVLAKAEKYKELLISITKRLK